MKRHLWYTLLAVSAVAFGCHQQQDRQTISQYTQRLSKPDTLPKQLIIKDRGQYSQQFINGLQKANYPGKIILEGNYIVVGKDTTHFPEDLKTGVAYQFTTHKDSLTYSINIKRLNLTDLMFDCKVNKGAVPVFSRKGKAVLAPLFFLAAEAPEDEQTGELFGAYSYSPDSPNSTFVIKIGIGRDDNEHLRAVIRGDKAINTSPVLRTMKN